MFSNQHWCIWLSNTTTRMSMSLERWTIQLCSLNAQRSSLKSSSLTASLSKLLTIGGKMLSCLNTSTHKKKWTCIAQDWTAIWTSPWLTCTSTIASGFSYFVSTCKRFFSISISVSAMISTYWPLALRQNSLVRPLNQLAPSLNLLVAKWTEKLGSAYTTKRAWTFLSTLWSAINILTLFGPKSCSQTVPRSALSAPLPSPRSASINTNSTGSSSLLLFSSPRLRRWWLMRETRTFSRK